MLRRAAALAALLLGGAVPAAAQRGRTDLPAPFTIADILSAPFPSELVASPDGRRVAWIGYEQGKRNVWVAEAPAYRARRLTRYTDDDGQDLTGLVWTADSRALLYVRGRGPNAAGENPNPTSDPRGAEQAVWLVAVAGGVPRRLGAGADPAPSPAGDRVAFVYRDTIWTAPLRAAGAAQVLFRARGRSGSPTWSPNGRQLAFVSRRGDHAFIGVFDVARREVRWIAPDVDNDDVPRWSPDGKQLAFIRRPGSLVPAGPPAVPAPNTTLPAFRLMVADVATLEAREVWRSPPGPDGAFPGLAGEWALGWAADERLVFASEQTGWLGLYAAPLAGGEAARLTPAGCEVEDAVLTRDRREAVYTSNCGDSDRRHVQRVALAGGAPVAVTSGPGLEWRPAPLDSGRVAVLRSDAHHPAAPALVSDTAGPVVLDGWPLPPAFPIEQLVAPQPVIVRAADSTEVHLQLFLPPPGGQADGGRRPAIMFFHGGPIRQMLLGWHNRGYYHNAYALNQYLASRGFVVVSVNYRLGIGYGRQFRDVPCGGRSGACEYQDVLAAAAYLRARPDVDSTRIGLWGGSYGGYLTALGMARNSDLFAAGVDLHGVHDWAVIAQGFPFERGAASDSALARMRRSSPVADVERWRSPVLLIHGDDDRNVQFQQTTDLAQRLRRRGVRVEELVFPDEVHSFLRHASWLRAYRAAAEFFAGTLGTREAR
jgi:dipeptidyl aminopeptidase/acylaminoacyl peptidase